MYVCVCIYIYIYIYIYLLIIYPMITTSANQTLRLPRYFYVSQ
jgi:hypothetical protein